MNKQEYLLTVLTEECSEIQKDVCKALRFGLNDANPGTDKTNKELIQEELNDLLGTIALLVDEGIIDEDYQNQQAIYKKKQKVIHYMKYSQEQGCLDE